MKKKNFYVCTNCGYTSAKWLGKCPECGAWDSFVLKEEEESKGKSRVSFEKPVSFLEIEKSYFERFSSGDEEFDRVLGGGFVNGEVLLIAGEPGIGKSTLILQIAQGVSRHSSKVLYVSGEESLEQVKMRAERLGIEGKNLYLLSTVYMEDVLSALEESSYSLCIIDSIQTLHFGRIDSTPGSILQLREVTKASIEVAKKNGIVFVLIGHVTKSGDIAGPKILEHLVDAVFYFEGERFSNTRILRSIKNRFGATHEIALYELTSEGLKKADEGKTIGELSQRKNVYGITIFPLLEGTRPILVEIQALTTETPFMGNPRRMFQGIERARGAMLIALIEKRLNVKLFQDDVFLKVSDGLFVREPSADLSVIASILSSKFEVPVIDTVFVGEVSLSGEIKPERAIEKRISGLKTFGLKSIVGNFKKKDLSFEGFDFYPIKNISELKSIFKR